MLSALGKLGTSEEPTMPDSTTTPSDGLDLKRTFPNMRTLHNIRKDWLSDEEMWLAIPEGVASWIHKLERRDMMLLGSLTENEFGFAGSYAKKQQARLAPIPTGWKRWLEFNTTNTDKRHPAKWLMNLRRASSISTNTVEKAVTWNVGPHGYQKGKEEIQRIFQLC